MQPIPQPITNVSVYPYIPQAPIQVQPVYEGGDGTYSVGTLLTHVFYNMDLHGGSVVGQISKGATYYAMATASDGTVFQTHWMYCLTDGDSPTFGLTKNLVNPTEVAPTIGAADGPYIDLGAMVDVSVSQPFKPPAIGVLGLISNANGEQISTRVGTPHLMGFKVDNPGSNLLHKGMDRITVTGKRASDGQELTYTNLVCVDAGNPAVFLQRFP